MPVLPTSDALGQANIGESNRPASSVETNAVGSGLAALGSGMKSFGKDVYSIVNKQQKETSALNGTSATAMVLQSHNDYERELQNNPGNWKAWGDNITKKTAETIRTAADYFFKNDEVSKRKWIAAENLRAQRTIDRFKSLAREKQIDFANANIEAQKIQAMKDIGDKSIPSERKEAIINNIRNMFSEQAKLGLMTQEMAVRNAQNWRTGAATEWLKNLPPEQRIEAVGGVAGGTDLEMAKNILRKREGFITGTKYDMNHERLGYGSDTITHADGTVSVVKKGDTVTKEDAERDLARRAQLSLNHVKDIAGEEAFNKLSPAARAALTSVAYNYGSFNKLPSLMAAIRTGDNEKVADAIEKLAPHNNGINAGRRKYEANIARGNLNAPSGFAGVLTNSQREAVIQGAAREIQSNNNAERVSFQNSMNDISAMVSTGAQVPATMMAQATPENFNKYYGDQGPAQWEKFQSVRQGAEAIGSMHSKSNAEIDENVASFAPKPGPGYAESVKQYNIIANAAKKVKEAREEDPVRVMAERDPQLAQLVSKLYNPSTPLAQLPELSQQYLNRLDGERQRLGIQNQAVLPNDLVGNFSEGIKKAAAKGEWTAVVGALNQAEAQWGTAWPRVLEQLVKKDVLPPQVEVIASMNRPTQQTGAQILVQSLATPKPQLLKNVDVKQSELTEEVNKHFFTFSATVDALRNSGKLGAYREAIEFIALGRKARGETMEAAVKNAYEDVIGKAYHPLQKTVTYRVPIERDLEKVRAGADFISGDIKNLNLDIPPDALQGVTVQQARYLYNSAIAYKWITSPNEDGLVMVNRKSGMPVFKDGKILKYTWDQLENLETEMSGSKSPTAGEGELMIKRPQLDIVAKPGTR